MRRYLLALPVSALLVLAAPAVALTPTSGTYEGTGKATCKVEGKAKMCKYAVTMKVSGGKITDFKMKSGTFTLFTPVQKAIKVASSGKFSKTEKYASGDRTLKGRFTSSTKVKGSYTGVSPDSTISVAKTTFTLKRK